MSTAAKYLRRYFQVTKAIAPRTILFTILTIITSAFLRWLYNVLTYRTGYPLAYADNVILFGFFFYMSIRVVLASFLNKVKLWFHEVPDFIILQSPFLIMLWVVYFCARQFTAGQCVAFLLIIQHYSSFSSVVLSVEPNKPMFTKATIIKGIILGNVGNLFVWVTVSMVSLTFWISNYSNSNLDSDFTGFFSIQNMVFLVYTGLIFPVLKNGIINFYINKGIASLVNQKGEDAMRTLAWQLQFSMGYEIFFSLPGKIITFRTSNQTVFIVSVFFYCIVDMGFRIMAAINMKKRIALAMEAVQEAVTEENERIRANSIAVANQIVEDDEESEPAEIKDLTSNVRDSVPKLLTEPLPNPVKIFDKSDKENTIENHTIKFVTEVSEGLAKTLSTSLNNLRGSKVDLKVAPADLEKGSREQKCKSSGRSRAPSISAGMITRKLTTTVQNAATTIKEAAKDDDKEEDFEAFADGMSHLQDVNKVASTVKASRRASMISARRSTITGPLTEKSGRRGTLLPPIDKERKNSVSPSYNTTNNASATDGKTTFKTGAVPFNITKVDTQALKRVFAITSMANCFAEWVSRFACVVHVVIFISYIPETTCYGQPSFVQTIIYGAIMIAISTSFDLIGAVIQERILDFDITDGARAFGKLKLGWRTTGYFTLLILCIPGALLFLEGGFFGENSFDDIDGDGIRLLCYRNASSELRFWDLESEGSLSSAYISQRRGQVDGSKSFATYRREWVKGLWMGRVEMGFYIESKRKHSETSMDIRGSMGKWAEMRVLVEGDTFIFWSRTWADDINGQNADGNVWVKAFQLVENEVGNFEAISLWDWDNVTWDEHKIDSLHIADGILMVVLTPSSSSSTTTTLRFFNSSTGQPLHSSRTPSVSSVSISRARGRYIKTSIQLIKGGLVLIFKGTRLAVFNPLQNAWIIPMEASVELDTFVDDLSGWWNRNNGVGDADMAHVECFATVGECLVLTDGEVVKVWDVCRRSVEVYHRDWRAEGEMAVGTRRGGEFGVWVIYEDVKEASGVVEGGSGGVQVEMLRVSKGD
ncbi:hypothetical protein HDV05_000694 [Chytridiales sp. JEL 0842]|nr:hypothetical protein HDV05_000694 [Chytridiales sp. JEL 0842]